MILPPMRLTLHGSGAATVVLALSLLAGPGAAQVTSARPTFSAADVFQLRGVADIQMSPDGRSIAYQASDTDIMIDGRRSSIRMIDVASGQDRMLATDASSPRWSPDGRSIVYVASGPDGVVRIMIADSENGTRRAIAELAGLSSEIVWSPDGRALAFTRFVAEPVQAPPTPVSKPEGAAWAAPLRIISSVRYERDGQGAVEPGHVQLFILAVEGGAPTQLTRGDADIDGGPVWTQDGAALIVAERRGDERQRGYQNARLWRVPVEGGEQVPLSPADLGARSPTVSPDGSRIAFIAVAQDGRDYSASGLYVANADGLGLRRLDGTLDREVDSPRWSGDGRTIYVGYGDHGLGKVGRFDLDGRWSEVAAGVTGDYSLSQTGALAYALGRADRPADVAVTLPNGTVRQLTDRNADLLNARTLGAVRPLRVRSTLDGAQVGAWLTLPPGYRRDTRYPTIIVVHGGPYGFDGPLWSTTDQLYAAAGYVVLHANYRGSTSYGFAFADRIGRDFPGPAYADLMSAADAAIDAGVADPDRLFITGGSAGGHLTAWAVGSTDRFRAAMAEKPVINAVSKALTTDQYVGSSSSYGGLEAWEAPERYWSMSPLSRVGAVKTPTMLVVGEEDRRTPVSESRQFYNALTLRGIPTALVVVPGASHSSLGRRPSQLLQEIDLTLDWFGRYGGIDDVQRRTRYPR